MLKSWRFWLIAGLLAVLAAGGFLAFRRFTAVRQSAAGAGLQLGEVSRITAVRTVTGSGSVAARRLSTLTWKTSGSVAEVNVSAGDRVRAGDVLLQLDPQSAPQNIILAQADLITAKENLDKLLHPPAMDVANAQKAVADAQAGLDKAQRSLHSLASPDVDVYAQRVAEAETAVRQAEQNAEISALGETARAVTSAQEALENALTRLNDTRSLEERYPGCCATRVEDAQQAYDQALDNLRVAQLRLEQAQANNASSLEDAHDRLADAQANLAAARGAPDALKLAQAEAEVAVAEARLADAQEKLDQLLTGPEPDEVAAATARLQAAQSVVDSLAIRAPHDGEVLVVNFEPGDLVSQNQAAVVLADRSRQFVEVSIDETDVTEIQAGAEAALTFDSLPEVSLAGQVVFVNPVGAAEQGLVRYKVRVDLLEGHPQVLLGMTANVSIVAEVLQDALTVPLDAVQLDETGEYVNRLKPDVDPSALPGGAVSGPGGGPPIGILVGPPGGPASGAPPFGPDLSDLFERVSVVSSLVEGDRVVVAGDLQPGDQVQIVVPQPTNSGSPFGPG